MRIVGGKVRGAALAGPKTDRIRPTSDRLRETIFNILAHGFDDPVSGGRALDLFAGTGALGLEALSRGAAHCLFVEQAAEARALIRRNVEALGLTGATRIFRRDATRLGPAGTIGTFDVVFCDPPYGRGLGEAALVSARAGGWIAHDAVIVVEDRTAAGFEAPDGLRIVDRRVVGDSQVLFLVVD